MRVKEEGRSLLVGEAVADLLRAKRRSWAEFVGLGSPKRDLREGLLAQRSEDSEETESFGGGFEESTGDFGGWEGAAVVVTGRIAWFL
jgi:hypothetical protein